MLTVVDTRPDRNCGGLDRREFLRIGALGLGRSGGAPVADRLRKCVAEACVCTRQGGSSAVSGRRATSA